MGRKVIYEVGDLIQGGSYPEAIWRVVYVEDRHCQLAAWYVPEGYWVPESPTCMVPMWDFEPANAMLVLAASSR